MKKMGLVVMMATVCLFAGINMAMAASYNFSWKNNMNMFTYSNNADAVCTNIKTELQLAGSTVASYTIPRLAADEQAGFQLSSPVCSSIKFTATCTFKDSAGQRKTETKHYTRTTNCWGGDGYLSPSPMNKSWTTFQMDYYCTPPCQ